MRTELDPVDHEPIWAPSEGERFVADLLAWQRLGIGQRCETWLCWSTGMWAPVAVKLPRPQQLEHPRARAALAREAGNLRLLRHPLVPQLLHDDLTAETPYLVTEYLDGIALDDLVSETGPLTAAEVAMLAASLASVLQWIHRHGVVHLDLKPANVIVRADVPMLIDFGSARPVGQRQPSGTMIGSPGYGAPELESGNALTTAMDLFGLGAVLYECLTGAPTFDPDVPAVARSRPVPAARVLGQCEASRTDLELCALIDELLATEPRYRPASAGEVLSRLSIGLPWSGTTAGHPTLATAGSATATSAAG